MTIKIASCEDDSGIRKSIESFFKKIEEETDYEISVSFFCNGEQLISSYKSDFDILLLDIHMGDGNLNGIQIASQIRAKDDKVLIMFLTSLTRYLKEGYKVKAFRYLTKPITYSEFKNEICCAIKEVKKRADSYLNIIEHSIYYRLSLDDITYIETDGRKTLIHTKTNNLKSSYSISYFSDLLSNKNFYRCHNSYVINLLHIDCLKVKSVYVDGVEIPVSRQKLKKLKEKMASLLGDFL